MELVAGFGLSPAEAVFGKTLRQNWLELSSLGETHARIAIRLAGARSTEVTAAEQDQLLELPDGCQTISLSDAQQVKEGLASLGVRWSVPRKRILALHAAKRAADKARIESALSADKRALFEAARANNRRKIGALLAADVNVEVRTVDGQWAYTPAGDTPLIQACKAKSRSAALALISSGADPNAHNKFMSSRPVSCGQCVRACATSSRRVLTPAGIQISRTGTTKPRCSGRRRPATLRWSSD